jgi:lysozyme family protein
MENDSPRFTRVLAFTLEWEGGYSNDPDDPGGATKYGITQNDVNYYFDDKVERINVKYLTLTQARAIYFAAYWEPCHCQYMFNPTGDVFPTAYALFDTAVNCGVATSIGFLQEFLGVKKTGFFDYETSSNFWTNIYNVGWTNIHNVDTGKQAAFAVLGRRRLYYSKLVDDYPRLEKFYRGWMNRTDSLADLITKL